MTDKEGVESFMQFLQREVKSISTTFLFCEQFLQQNVCVCCCCFLQFATENLLFAIEYMQFVQLVRMSHFKDMFETAIGGVFKLPHDFPLSEINAGFDGNDRFEFYLQIRATEKALYNKYIATGCTLEININHRLRNEMKKVFAIESENLEDHEGSIHSVNAKSVEGEAVIVSAMKLFERAFFEVSNMLAGSYTRFVVSEQGCQVLMRLQTKGLIIDEIVIDEGS